jgi:hypothetical protein
MSSRTLARSIVAVAVLTVAITAAYAGGWSIITLNHLPDYAIAGKPIPLTFSVRQHGSTLISDLKPTLRAVTAAGLEVKAAATPTQHPGEYTATLVFPAPGDWTIKIDGGFNPEDKTRAYNSVTLRPLIVIHGDGSTRVSVSKGARGDALFVAKGCVGCHSDSARNVKHTQLAAPDLKKFLADPGTAGVEMPDLKLKEDEIAALVAFINAK